MQCGSIIYNEAQEAVYINCFETPSVYKNYSDVLHLIVTYVIRKYCFNYMLLFQMHVTPYTFFNILLTATCKKIDVMCTRRTIKIINSTFINISSFFKYGTI